MYTSQVYKKTALDLPRVLIGQSLYLICIPMRHVKGNSTRRGTRLLERNVPLGMFHKTQGENT